MGGTAGTKTLGQDTQSCEGVSALETETCAKTEVKVQGAEASASLGSQAVGGCCPGPDVALLGADCC